MALSSFLKHDLWTYMRTRYPWWLALSLPLLISVAAVFSFRPVSPYAAIVVYLQAILLVFEFRLWDDLADRDQDQCVHPDRVLCQAPTLRPFYSLLCVMAVINFYCVLGRFTWTSAMVFVSLHLFLAFWYWIRQRIPARLVANYHCVLLKYPAFVLILGDPLNGEVSPLLHRAGAIYLLLCIYEVLHDPTVRSLGMARVLCLLEISLLFTLTTYVHYMLI